MAFWRVFFLFVFSVFGIQAVYAQKLPMPSDDLLLSTTEDEKKSWKFSLRGGLNGSQAYYRSWAQGGVDRIAVVGNTVFTGVYTEGSFQYGFRVDMRYGRTSQDRGSFRKSEDMLRVRNQFRRRFTDERFSMTSNINFETQFDKGYDSSFENVQSRFMSPGTLTETVGLSYDPGNHLDLTVGMSLRQTFIKDTTLSERYGLEEGDWFRNEAGFTVIVSYEREIWDNVTYSAYLETFSNLQKSLFNTDFRINNEFVGRINNYLTANLDFSLQYNDDITKKLQIRQLISIGLNYTFM
ncbi:DUF3078 domain-containing protein [Balneolaceae bacterium ANBcel3]|nr:DUF3078 domain-containing protein [Balneolaceae bacterium ANBcel3]